MHLDAAVGVNACLRSDVSICVVISFCYCMVVFVLPVVRGTERGDADVEGTSEEAV